MRPDKESVKKSMFLIDGLLKQNDVLHYPFLMVVGITLLYWSLKKEMKHIYKELE
jgi:hypothetical protein